MVFPEEPLVHYPEDPLVYYLADKTKVASTTVDGDTFLTNLETSHCYSLNQCAMAIWEALNECACGSYQLTWMLTQNYGPQNQELGEQVERFLEEMLRERLIQLADSDSEALGQPVGRDTPDLELEPPQLRKLEQVDLPSPSSE